MRSPALANKKHILGQDPVGVCPLSVRKFWRCVYFAKSFSSRLFRAVASLRRQKRRCRGPLSDRSRGRPDRRGFSTRPPSPPSSNSVGQAMRATFGSGRSEKQEIYEIFPLLLDALRSADPLPVGLCDYRWIGAKRPVDVSNAKTSTGSCANVVTSGPRTIRQRLPFTMPNVVNKGSPARRTSTTSGLNESPDFKFPESSSAQHKWVR
jgi:hypothetical protein